MTVEVWDKICPYYSQGIQATNITLQYLNNKNHHVLEYTYITILSFFLFLHHVMLSSNLSLKYCKQCLKLETELKK